MALCVGNGNGRYSPKLCCFNFALAICGGTCNLAEEASYTIWPMAEFVLIFVTYSLYWESSNGNHPLMKIEVFSWLYGGKERRHLFVNLHGWLILVLTFVSEVASLLIWWLKIILWMVHWRIHIELVCLCQIWFDPVWFHMLRYYILSCCVLHCRRNLHLTCWTL